MSSRFALWPPVPATGIAWPKLLPWLPAEITRPAAAARDAYNIAARNFLLSAAAVGTNTVATATNELLVAAETYLTLVTTLANQCGNAMRYSATEPIIVSWHVNLFAVPTPDAVPYTETSSVFFERVCATLAVAVAAQRADNLARCTTLLHQLRNDVLVLFRSGNVRPSCRWLSQDVIGAVHCAVAAQALIRTKTDMATLMRAAELVDRAVGVLPMEPALRTAQAKSRAFAFAALAKMAIETCGDAGVAEALLRDAVAGMEAAGVPAGQLTKRFESVKEENRVVYGCMRVPRHVRIEGVVAGELQGVHMHITHEDIEHIDEATETTAILQYAKQQ